MLVVIRTQVYIPDDLYKEAKFKAQITNKTISDFMREGLRMFIKKIPVKKGKTLELMDLAGKFTYKKKKHTNAGIMHNEIYDL